MPPLYAVTKTMPHHRGNAGYNRLLDHVEPRVVVRAPAGRLWSMAGATSRRAWSPFTGSAWYGAPSLVAELTLARHALAGPPGIVHVLYGEDLLLLTGHLRRRHRVVATFHQPPERFDRLVTRRGVYDSIDAAIVLDDHNAAAWRARIGDARVHRLTLGVDCGFWSPAGARSAEASVVTVGNHLRDFEVLEATIARLPEVRFDLVIPAAHTRRFEGRPNVRVHEDVSDEALADLYRGAHALFLPLLGGSASNTVLQALASGLPVVTTTYGGAPTYLDDTVARFAAPGDAADHARCLSQLLADPSRGRLASAARAKAFDYSWERVAGRHLALYASLSEQK